MDLNGRAALITGGRRMGGAVASALAARGCDVALTFHRSRGDAEDAGAQVRAAGRRAALLQKNLSRPEDCEGAVNEAAGAFGRLDILVNMASVYTSIDFDRLTLDAWQQVMDVDLRAAFLCARAAVPHMRRAGGGRIVNFSDWVARSGRPRYKGYLAYYVAKHAVIGLTEALALELAGDQILVNAVAPGPILAPQGTTPEEHAAVERATPVGRWGGAEEIAKAVIALIDSDFITGETVRVDGGRHVK
jgi:NAD(P)-dependent dehydrogenase (short-subunit alcohol dehydrogenase family)